MEKFKDKTYVVVCGDFDNAKNAMRKEMYRHLTVAKLKKLTEEI